MTQWQQWHSVREALVAQHALRHWGIDFCRSCYRVIPQGHLVCEAYCRRADA